MKRSDLNTDRRTFRSKLLDRKWLSENVFTLELEKPASFSFTPGQRIGLIHRGIERDYSIASAAEGRQIELCIRRVKEGQVSPLLAKVERGTSFQYAEPTGHFTYRSSSRVSIFIATGTGIAPFAAMARSGVAGFILIQGADLPEHLYYESLFRSTAREYIPCLSSSAGSHRIPDEYQGRVSSYLKEHLAEGVYDFYLCGRSEMIRDAMAIIDAQFPESRVYAERFS